LLFFLYIVAGMNNIANKQGAGEDSLGGRLMDAMKKFSENYAQFESKRAAKFGLHPAEARCLLFFRDKRYLTVKELADLLGLVKSRVVRIVDELETKLLVERFPDPADGRIVLIGLTSGGKNKLRLLQDCCRDTSRFLWDSFHNPFKETLPETLEQLSAQLQDISGRELQTAVEV